MLLVLRFTILRRFGWTVAKSKRNKSFPHRQIIGEAIRRFRKEAKFTQETLAEKVRLNPKYIGEIERGEKIISIEALMRIAETVKVPLANFFQGL
jgi:DNA-binding XRE family transcriptional regulator